MEVLLLALRLNLVEGQGFSGNRLLNRNNLRISLAGFLEELEVVLVAGSKRAWVFSSSPNNNLGGFSARVPPASHSLWAVQRARRT